MKSTYFFPQQLLRLKELLKAKEDQDVATALGMTKAAFSARKARGSFPETELYALAARQPELGIDVPYVLTGLAQTTREMIHAVKAGAPLVKATTQEQHLLTLWRSCAPADQKLLLEIASRLGKAPL